MLGIEEEEEEEVEVEGTENEEEEEEEDVEEGEESVEGPILSIIFPRTSFPQFPVSLLTSLILDSGTVMPLLLVFVGMLLDELDRASSFIIFGVFSLYIE